MMSGMEWVENLKEMVEFPQLLAVKLGFPDFRTISDNAVLPFRKDKMTVEVKDVLLFVRAVLYSLVIPLL